MATELTPIEDLDRSILNLSCRINAATYKLLVLIREFDERVGWLKWGMQNCAEWLAWRCDFSMTTALEKVRVAHALKSLPAISRGFATGELSYSKVRALTRVANRQNEIELLAFALRQPAAHVAERCRELRCGTAASSRTVDYLVTIHVDQSALAGREGRASLPIESVKRICCDSHAVVLTEDEQGEPLGIGRKSRLIPTAIQRALNARDQGCCRFPGCRNRRYLHSHHIEHWSNGGETSLGNLMLLCTKHHTLVHEGGFRIERDFQNRWYFLRPDGIAVPACGYSAMDTVDDDDSEPNDIPPAGGLLSMADKIVAEPAAPVYLH